ncbi:ATP-binding cassette domain-containing protein [Halobacteria archaeon AArc-dxtr1]|nr:ATP-binding cassette domain-containing protein [Halobacteria archaeon AArc-dxtr1]
MTDDRPTDAEPILSAEGLTKHYESNQGVLDSLLGRSVPVRALEGVDLELYPGETLGIVGESGSGKTTLGRALLRLVEPTAGTVAYRPRDGSHPESVDHTVDLTAVSNSRLRDLRTELQYVFQDPSASLNPRLTVGEIVGEPLEIHDIADGTARTDRVRDLLETVGLDPDHAARYPHEFSGGQRRRIGIARALAVEPSVIVCDEPVSGLDVSTQAQIVNLLADLQASHGLSYVVIAHDLRVVEHVADRIAVMYLGEIVEQGRTEDVFAAPHHPYTEALLSAIPEPDPRWDGERIRLSGTVPSPVDPPSGCRFHTRCPRAVAPAEYDISADTWQSLLALWRQLDGAEGIEAVVSASEIDPFVGDGIDTSTANEADTSAADGIDAPAVDTLDRRVRSAFSLPRPLADPRAESALSATIERLSESGIEPALSHLEATFASPCVTHRPTSTALDDGHEIACIRYDDELPGRIPGRGADAGENE